MAESSPSVKEVFADAIELEGSARASFVERRCAGNASMCRRVLELLEAHERAEAFMGAPTIGAPPGSGDAEALVGTSIGAYEIEAVLGSGGFGVVYLARQREPVDRTVAIKVIRSDVHSPSSEARLRAERRILARMEHANIAKIHDAGRTSDGRSFVVMEYVEGTPITTFCDERRMTTRERLHLFERVCLAVQHAHLKGVIHRDLKPSNVLVTEIDGVPEPRVIDFGIAKDDEEDAGRSMVTQAGQIIGTPAFMSPEQIDGSGDADTRSDVYALGAMLYELLARETPFDRKRLSGAGLAGLARIICEEDPPRPSSRVMQASNVEASEARRLSGEIRGELDWIVLRAIEKSPARRYQTAQALAMDVRRFLRDEPLDAGPPSRRYRFGKFARRHRGALAGLGVAGVALVGLVVASVVFAVHADRQRREIETQLDRARELATFASGMFDGIDPAFALGEDRTLVRRLLTDSIRRIESSPPESEEASIEIRELLGDALRSIADFDEALDQYSKAVVISDRLHGVGSEESLGLRGRRGELLVETSRFEEARREMLGVRDGYAHLFGSDHPDTLSATFVLGAIARMERDDARARSIFEGLLDRSIAVRGSEDPETMSIRNSLGVVLSNLGEHDRAIELLETVIESQEETLEPEHPRLQATRGNLADVYRKVGRVDEALHLLVTSLEIKRRILAPGHPSLLISLNNVGRMSMRLGRVEEGGTMLAEALDLSREHFGDGDHRTLTLAANLAECRMLEGRPEEALVLLDEALPLAEETLAPEHALLFAMRLRRARAVLETGAIDRAIDLSAALVTQVDTDAPDRVGWGASSRLCLGRALMDAGRPGEAERPLREAWDMFGDTDDEDRREAAMCLAEVYAALEREEDAAMWDRRANEGEEDDR